jgi:hypothetical protein
MTWLQRFFGGGQPQPIRRALSCVPQQAELPALCGTPSDTQWGTGLTVLWQTKLNVKSLAVFTSGFCWLDRDIHWVSSDDHERVLTRGASALLEPDARVLALGADFILSKVGRETLAFADLAADCTWRLDLGGDIFSAAIPTSGSIAYIGTRETANGPGSLYIIDRGGRVIREHRFREQIGSPFGLVQAFPYHLVTAQGGELAACSCMGLVYLFDQQGHMLWSADTFDWRPKAPSPPPTSDAAERIAREVVDAMVVGFTRTEPVASLEFAARQDRVYICSQDGHLYCVNRAGQLQWHFPSTLGDSSPGVHPCITVGEPSGQSILVV